MPVCGSDVVGVVGVLVALVVLGVEVAVVSDGVGFAAGVVSVGGSRWGWSPSALGWPSR